MALTPRSLFASLAAFSKEAVRRKVWITAGAYIAISIGVIEISGAVAEALLFPAWTDRLVTFLLILGFPLVVVLAWIFDIGDGRLERTSAAEDAPRGSTASRPGAESTRTTRSIRSPLRMPEARTTTALDAVDPQDAVDDAPPNPERLKRAALGHVRHELRTPINAIVGYSEMLLEDDPDGEAADDLVRIRDSGRQLLDLVDSILDAGRIEADGDRDIESYAAQIEADLRTPITSVIGYCEMLVEAESEAGRSTMTPDLERIADAARTLLTSSSDIVRVAEGAGDISGTAASSAMTSGVLAKLRPVTSAEVEGEGSLLVVDDNPTNRDLLTRQLARHGYMVVTAVDGAEALEKMQRQAFDLVLLDVIMPNVDGVEALKRIKADARLRETSVIMLSSLDEVDSAVRCLQLGAEEYLAKPVESALLEARIRANLEVRRLRTRERLLNDRVAQDDALIDRFLTRGIPSSMAEQVRRGSEAIVETRPAAAVLCARLDQAAFGAGALDEFVTFLGDAFTRFDAAASSFGAVDARLAEHRGLVAASFDGNGDGRTDAGALVRLAKAFLAELATDASDAPSLFRCGIHVGPLTGSLFGSPRPRFDLWGDAVDVARAVAELAEPGAILVTPPVRKLLADSVGLEPVGVSEVGDRGTMRLHRVATS